MINHLVADVLRREDAAAAVFLENYIVATLVIKGDMTFPKGGTLYQNDCNQFGAIFSCWESADKRASTLRQHNEKIAAAAREVYGKIASFRMVILDCWCCTGLRRAVRQLSEGRYPIKASCPPAVRGPAVRGTATGRHP